MTASGSDSIQLAMVENIYQNDSCSGSIVGTYSLPFPVTATYQYPTTASFPAVTIMPSSDTVESVSIFAPAMTAQLIGSGVSGSCVTYTNGNVCFNDLTTTAATQSAAIYLRGNYFVTFGLTNGLLVSNGIFSKDSSFAFNSLVSTTVTPATTSTMSKVELASITRCTATGRTLFSCLL